MIEIKDADVFFEIQKKIKKIPFTQSKGWYKHALHKNNDICFYVDNDTNVNIALWGRVQKIPFTNKKLLLINGEAISQNLDEKKVIQFYENLCKTDYQGIELNSDNEYNIEFEIGLRRAGFVRPIGGFTCPLTINFQIQNDFNFNRNWKRNVKKAIASELRFEEVTTITDEVIKTVILMFKEMADLKNLSYQLEEDSLASLLNSPDMRLFVVYDKQDQPVAARVIHDNKPYASDVYAANSLEARGNGATYFIMQKIFEQLKDESFQEFDFGRIPPSNHATDSVYIFKNASRGKKIQYNGEWSFYKSKWLEFLLFSYKSIKLKKQRY